MDKQYTEDQLSLGKVAQEPGVKDLSLKVRGPFAKAVIAERKGDAAQAEVQLHKAVAAEQGAE